MKIRSVILPVFMTALTLHAHESSAATYFPTSLPDLIAAINSANADPSSSVIVLGGLTFMIASVNNTTDGANGLPVITSQIAILNGTIARDPAAPPFRLLYVASNASVVLQNMTLSGGEAGQSRGGAIFNRGLLTIRASTLSANSSDDLGGAVYNVGAIGTIANSTFSGNAAWEGGAIGNDGTIAMGTATLVLNTASFTGGGIFNGRAGFIGSFSGCIVAKNTAGDSPNMDIDNQGYITGASYNLIGNGSGSGLLNGVGFNQVGTTGSPIDPLVGPLQNNGGPTRTHALLAGSPAIDAGNDLAFQHFDQRGTPYVRIWGPAPDIGAFEVQPIAELSVTNVPAPDPVMAGTNLVFTITAVNAGPDAAPAASLTDSLPAGMSFVSLPSPAGWSCTTPALGAGGTVTCTNVSFVPGSAVFALTVKVGAGVPSGTVLSNTATTSSTATDPNPGNESSTANVAVTAVLVPAVPALGSFGLALMTAALAATGAITIRAVRG